MAVRITSLIDYPPAARNDHALKRPGDCAEPTQHQAILTRQSDAILRALTEARDPTGIDGIVSTAALCRKVGIKIDRLRHLVRLMRLEGHDIRVVYGRGYRLHR